MAQSGHPTPDPQAVPLGLTSFWSAPMKSREAVAKALGCDTDMSAFYKKLGKLAKASAKPPPRK